MAEIAIHSLRSNWLGARREGESASPSHTRPTQLQSPRPISAQPGCSASHLGWYVFSVPAAPVAQTCSLLYRRFLTCHLPPASNLLPITNRRYGRLKICATLNGYLGCRRGRHLAVRNGASKRGVDCKAHKTIRQAGCSRCIGTGGTPAATLFRGHRTSQTTQAAARRAVEMMQWKDSDGHLRCQPSGRRP